MSDDFGRTGVDPEWYDHGPGSEEHKREREKDRAAVHEQIEREREAAVEQLRARLAELEAVVATLPKCWRLVDGKLVCDKPVTPRMEVWFWNGFPDCRIEGPEKVTEITFDEHDPDAELEVNEESPCHFYDSREAAEAAKNATGPSKSR